MHNFLYLQCNTSLHLDAIDFGSAHFGSGVGQIYLDNVNCTGRESNLTECPQSSTVTCTNGHSQDAGVRCQGMYFYETFTQLWALKLRGEGHTCTKGT